MSYIWFSSSTGIPANAVESGYDVDGSPIYVGRAAHESDLLPANVFPSKQVAYVSYNGEEIQKHQFEILSGSGFSWAPSGHGNVPPNAVVGGLTSTGEHLYIGRTYFSNSLTPGKVHCSKGGLYILLGGKEVLIESYEVLVEK